MTRVWFTEELYPFARISLNVRQILADEKSPYQHIQVFDTDRFGRVLVLDGIIQVTEFDHAAYHEMMVHIPALAVGNPKRALIVGGGDGAALKQVLRYPSIEEVVVCELDERVIEICRKFFPSFAPAWEDKRVNVNIGDAFEYLQKAPESSFDLILSDSTDPIGIAENLFSKEFYRLIVRALTPEGAAACQCDQPDFNPELVRRLYETAAKLVKNPAYYWALMPSFVGGAIGMMYLSNKPWQDGLKTPYPPGENEYLNPEIHRAAFALPEHFKRTMNITSDSKRAFHT
ncbi:MAG: polyamine aminopropyltransferase [Acidobacteria bacterium]|jgi:spermidine synthase|nr:MAG: polyamine aminopropyltransferase [Acidobacteriota bacterium]GIU82946.1 MAG: polyamine aminopropyltransferase [Pyrinomonadaceae bacterium]